jgi:hypothetical protein
MRLFGLILLAIFIAWIWNDTEQATVKTQATETAKPKIEMSEQQQNDFLNMTTTEAQAYINGDGESCPMVTGGALLYFPDSGEPYWGISCSDGSRYIVFWRDDIGMVKALAV